MRRARRWRASGCSGSGWTLTIRVGALPQFALDVPDELRLTSAPYFGGAWPGAAAPGQRYASADYAACLMACARSSTRSAVACAAPASALQCWRTW
ncbi:hypothetical protein [Xanthomonas theicola]|uniref:hypothetical protein n=1 Tax=Xanthomonas theicola TaxID=56464 RepID=UPI000FF8B705|nr:hypothetical protein [Xanthomonas theicola]QNH26120.1 hypothetical protein G4Q83_17110 [Xanthomonas theicola]